MEPLKLHFPVAPAWGQATTKEAGVAIEQATLADGVTREGEVQVDQGDHQPSRCQRKTNTLVNSPEWIN
jgi:hypothetical protein